MGCRGWKVKERTSEGVRKTEALSLRKTPQVWVLGGKKGDSLEGLLGGTFSSVRFNRASRPKIFLGVLGTKV